jgi:hypothetical protein
VWPYWGAGSAWAHRGIGGMVHSGLWCYSGSQCLAGGLTASVTSALLAHWGSVHLWHPVGVRHYGHWGQGGTLGLMAGWCALVSG